MSVAALIPIRTRAQYLESCLQALKKSSMPASEIFILASWLLPGEAERIQKIADSVDRVRVIWSDVDLPKARLTMARQSLAALVLNLDSDTMIPTEYLAEAVRLFKGHKRVGAVALNYSSNPMDHLGFGTSIMPTILFLELYDWQRSADSKTCECLYMWRKLSAAGLILATLPLAADHKQNKP